MGSSSSVSYSYVAILRCRATPLSDWVCPEFSGKVVKGFIHSIPELGYVKNLYEMPSKPKPLSISPLMLEGKPLVGTRKTAVPRGSVLSFEIRVAVPSMDEVPLVTQQFDEEVVFGGTRFRVWLEEVEVVGREGIRLGLPRGYLARIRFVSPALLSSKLMAPPLDTFLKKVSRVRNYVLYPSMGHLFSYLAKLWNALFPDDPVSRKYTAEWSAYFVGRLAEVAIKVVDYSSKPMTVVYDARRRPRGFVGWALIEVPYLGKRVFEMFDKLLGLAKVMGVGKSRAIGFGYVTVDVVQKR